MFKHTRQNSRNARTGKIFNELNTLIINCYENDDMRNLEKIIARLEDASVRAEMLLREIEHNCSVREFCEFCDYCR